MTGGVTLSITGPVARISLDRQASFNALQLADWKALEAVCARHPEHADRVRAAVGKLANAGLMEVESGGEDAAAWFPEQLDDYRLLSRLGAGGIG